MIMDNQKKTINISIADVIKLLAQDKKKLAVCSLVAGAIGLLFAFTTPRIYKSTVILAPEESGQGFSGSLSSIASMVGMNMKIGQTGDALYPEIYPDLMNSTDFTVKLFNIKVKSDKENKEYSYFEHLDKHQKVPLSSYPMNLINDFFESFKSPEPASNGKATDPFRLTKKEYDIMKTIQGNLSCAVDKKTDVITITVTDQDPLIAATVADSVKQHLQTAITEYRTKKARTDLKYIEEIYAEAKKQYDNARAKYASSADANMNAVFMSYKIKQKDVENDMQLKYSIYTTVAEQLQLAKAKVQERTPAFTIIQNASVPVKHSNFPKSLTLIIWLSIGFMIRFCMLLWKNRTTFVS